ncbi:hypothetical protein CONPUDRAFT_74779 [Coniophora puteana RWD-64-598 SS2]|uniref:AA1-like domain-containing protein n=1 Tax=Coniophora puteana (strain RWD-64-598) TaxID=741705 RepID=A0A5M3ML67_CONPW|nr:uncharacterized protein CONPUDRAFT_74779 [Coniophora puteana RWD-64-598 SS2]EIW79311.1 hypothetical protein CONPUDRAFT_74779 [Coniophora puteana RWD-64-598 SS2]
MKFLAFAIFAALTPLVSAWSVSVYVGDDQTCSTTSPTTITDVAPGDCVPLTEESNISSVKFDPSVGNGPFTGGLEIDFYQSIEFCGEGTGASVKYNASSTQDCQGATQAITYYKVWNITSS